MSAKRKNPYLEDAGDAAVPTIQSESVEIINVMTESMSRLLNEQRKFDRETVQKLHSLFGDKSLEWWIIFAGVGGLVEGLRLAYDVLHHYRVLQ